MLSIPGLGKNEQRKMCLSLETYVCSEIIHRVGSEINKHTWSRLPTKRSFQTGPVGEIFRGRNEDPVAHQVQYNASTLMQQRAVLNNIVLSD